MHSLMVTSGDNVIGLMVVLVIFVLVLVLTYYSSKWIAGYQKTQMINKNLEILEGLQLGGNKYICLVRVGETKCILLGVGKDDVSLLGEVSKDELKELPESAGSQAGGRGQSFSDVLSGFKEHMDKLKR